MTNPDGLAPEPNNNAWGTWEELLLASAVNRHGTTTAAWNSIASELQKGTSDPNLSLTPQTCRSKYLDLKRRFVASNGDLDDDKSNLQVSEPLLVELRKLRVAELRHEVQRYDLNIESLELRMKNMEAEREKIATDLNEKTVIEPESETDPSTDAATGEEMEKDQLPVNESNSTDLRAGKLKTGEKLSEPSRIGGDATEHDRTGRLREEPSSEPDEKPVQEDSCNGSSNSIEEPNRMKGKPVSEAAGLVELEAESDGGGGEDGRKENSDVQSSASRSMKEEGSDKVQRGCTSGDEREHVDQSVAANELLVESQPLIDFLRVIKARKFGSVFDRLIRSQESSKYQNLVRQHMDLETVETRLKEGWYSGCSSKFLRDLLLLVNNALIFFGKNSVEANAASEIRSLILKEIWHSQKQAAKTKSSSCKQISLHSLSMTKNQDAELPPQNSSMLLKPRMSGSSLPLIVCRKRSSIAKASAPSSDKKKEQTSLLVEETNEKLPLDEPKITKRRTRDRFSSVTAKKNVKNTTSNNSNKNSTAVGTSSSSQHTGTKDENKNQSSSLDSKKRGAVNFLNRMKQGGSSSNNSVLLDALKNTPLTSENTTNAKHKKNDDTKRKEPGGTRRGTETKQVKASPGKRNVGRPPKREVVQPSPTLGKRGRDRVEMEAPPPKQPKKRSKRS